MAEDGTSESARPRSPSPTSESKAMSRLKKSLRRPPQVHPNGLTRVVAEARAKGGSSSTATSRRPKPSTKWIFAGLSPFLLGGRKGESRKREQITVDLENDTGLPFIVTHEWDQRHTLTWSSAIRSGGTTLESGTCNLYSFPVVESSQRGDWQMVCEQGAVP